VQLEASKLGLGVDQILQEVIQHLVKAPGARVSVTLEIQAHLPEGADEHLVRRVTENASVLKFTTNQFDEA
jgi:hypothetical protein